jgi:hypothetical protein
MNNMLRHAIVALAILPAAAFAQAAPEGYRDVTVPAGRQPIRMFAPIAKPTLAQSQAARAPRAEIRLADAEPAATAVAANPKDQ